MTRLRPDTTNIFAPQGSKSSIIIGGRIYFRCEFADSCWLASECMHIGFIGRWVARMRTQRSVAFSKKWGVWGGLTLGHAMVGQEPIPVALRWLDVEMPRIWLPLALSSAFFTILFYAIVWTGLKQMARLAIQCLRTEVGRFIHPARPR